MQEYYRGTSFSTALSSSSSLHSSGAFTGRDSKTALTRRLIYHYGSLRHHDPQPQKPVLP
jgi:hypothetical protein